MAPVCRGSEWDMASSKEEGYLEISGSEGYDNGSDRSSDFINIEKERKDSA